MRSEELFDVLGLLTDLEDLRMELSKALDGNPLDEQTRGALFAIESVEIAVREHKVGKPWDLGTISF